MTTKDKYIRLKESIHLLTQESKDFELLIDGVFSSVILSSIKNYQNKIAAGVEDSASDLLEDFKCKVIESLLNSNATWNIKNEQNKEPFLFPDNCKFAHQYGKVSVFVIQQPPGCRRICFHDDLYKGKIVKSAYSLFHKLNLSFPYSVFFVTFVEDRLSGVYYSWTTKPLNSMDDVICRSVLPNIHENLSVCIGSPRAIVGRYSNICKYAIEDFWSSSFNMDLSSHWLASNYLDARFSSGKSWQEASIENPLWTMEVDFEQVKTVSEMVEFLANNVTCIDYESARKAINDEVDCLVANLFRKISNYFRKTKFERFYPKDIKNKFNQVMDESCKELIDLIKDLEKKLQEINVSDEEIITPKSDIFGEYYE